MAIAIVALVLDLTKAKKSDAVALEKRLTDLENNKFTDEDRRCLIELNSRFNVIWGVFEKDLPKFLRQETTPELDKLIDKIEQVGIRGLTKAQYDQLDRYLTEEYEKTLRDETESLQDRGFRLALYRAVAKYAYNHGIMPNCKPA
jgi:hypothetical protein